MKLRIVLILGAIVLVLGTLESNQMSKGKKVAYNARTGITTYGEKDPAANPQADEAAVAAPSTATSPAPAPAPAAPTPAQPAPQPLFSEADYNAWLPTADGWFTSHNVAPIAYLVSHGIPLPQEVHDALFNFINTQGGVGGVPAGVSDNDLFGHWIATVQDKESGPNGPFGGQGLFGNGGFLGTGISFGNDNVDQLASYGQGAMVGGNVGGTIATGNVSTDALTNAAVSDLGTLGSAALGPTVSGLAGGGMLGAAAGGAAGGALGGLLRGDSGRNIVEGAISGAATAGGTRLAGQGLANLFPAETPALPAPSTATNFADAGFDPTKRPGMLPLLAQADTGTMTDAPPALLSALDAQTLGDIATQKALEEGVQLTPSGMLAEDVPGVLTSTDSSTLGPIATQKALEEAGVFIDPTGAAQLLSGQSAAQPIPSPAPSDQTQQSPEDRATQMAKQVERIAKVGQALSKLNDGRGQPEDAPQRQDGQTDEQYVQNLVDYAAPIDPDLSAESLAEKGLTPGSPEYYQYVMDQMDSVINQVLGNTDVNSADLAAQLRAKTREELNALQRAIYIRGQIGQLMGSGQYTDPFTGVKEDVIAPKGKQVNPALAAYTRGLARSAEDLARMGPMDAQRFIGGMLERDPDLYGMQARSDYERQLAELLAQDDPMKRRRGLFGDSAPLFSELDPRDLAALQALLS